MKIRSITNFFTPTLRSTTASIQRLGAFSRSAEARFTAQGISVQTTRLATTPFPSYLDCSQPAAALKTVTGMEHLAESEGFSYLSFGPALPAHPAAYPLIPEFIAATRNSFFTAVIASVQEGISLPAVQACGQIIHDASTITADGFANLRFAALANVAPHTPFFPAAYHRGRRPGFALAVESADAAVDAFQRAATLAEARQNLLEHLQDFARQATLIADALAAESGMVFYGLDFSLAPFPDDACSLGGAIEALGAHLGSHGSLAAAAFVADLLDRGNWKRTGFNGLMLPVLEDSVLARRSADGSLSVRDLLMYSAVCGAGLDTVPLPGDAPADHLAALLLDVAALAVRLGKPLTARLMPVPGKKAGDPTEYDFGYFANGCVMQLPSVPLTGLLNSAETFSLQPRQPRIV